MQNIKYKFTALITSTIGVLFFFVTQLATAQEHTDILTKADSLFEIKRYTQSLEHYHQLFEEEQRYSPQMLLKMAYIHEGLGNISQALYFLNIYYTKTSDESVLRKLEELASENKLSGYQFTDTDLFLTYYNKYLSEITFGASALCLLLFAFVFYQKKKDQPVIFPAIGLAVALLLLAYIINGSTQTQKGIITNGTAYLMSGPSSGADVVEMVNDGHRVNILGKEDVWVKVIWNGEQVYVRQNQLLEL